MGKMVPGCGIFMIFHKRNIAKSGEYGIIVEYMSNYAVLSARQTQIYCQKGYFYVRT